MRRSCRKPRLLEIAEDQAQTYNPAEGSPHHPRGEDGSEGGDRFIASVFDPGRWVSDVLALADRFIRRLQENVQMGLMLGAPGPAERAARVGRP